MNNHQLITTILDNLGIVYRTEGNNVSEGSINIQCPFYDCGDQSNHMGIFEDSLKFSCWRCRRKGHFSFLLRIITGEDIEDCLELINETSGTSEKEGVDRIGEASTSWQSGKKSEKEKIETAPLPKYFEAVHRKMDYPLLFKYIKRRKLSLEKLIEDGCGVCRVGPYMNRMVFPVVQDKRQVSFAAADMTGMAMTPYLYPSMLINNYLYGYDGVRGTMIVTEGILDKRRVGEEAVAMFGLFLTDTQKSLIIKKNLDNLFFCLDGDAYWHARDESKFFHPYVDTVEVVHIPFEEDPDSLGTETVWGMIDSHLAKDLDLV